MPHRTRGPLALQPPSLLARRLLILLLLALPEAATGQLVGGPIVPSGQLRLDIDARYITWNQRFGLRGEAGSLVEELEPLGWNLSSDALGSDRLPGAALGEAQLRTLLDNPEYRHSLGSTRHFFEAHVRRVPLGFRLGVLDWLTVGASLPLVQRRLDSELIYSPDGANAGVAPSRSASTLFLSQYLTAVTSIRVAVNRRCASAPDSAACVEGQAVVRDADALLGTLSGLYAASVYMPLEDSEAGQALREMLEQVRSGISDVGFTSFTSELPLGTPMGQTHFDSLVVGPAFGLDGLPRRGLDGLWEPGDLEVSAAVRLLNTISPPAANPGAGASDSLAALPDDSGSRFGVQLAVEGTVRLGTGIAQDTLRDFLDMELMAGQMDIEVHGFGSLNWAHRVGVAFDVRYGIASPASVRRRIAPPDGGFAALPPADTVQWQPGNYLDYAVSPHLLLTPQLSLGVVYRSYRRNPDVYGGGAPDLAPLSLETEATVQSRGIAVRYSSFGTGSFPMVVRFGWETARSGTGGRTPKTGIVRFGASFFRRIWGGG